jgi:hypothetical protein
MLPCAAEINITFFFGGYAIPIHPLDVSMPVNTASDLCVGTVRDLTSLCAHVLIWFGWSPVPINNAEYNGYSPK